MIRESTTQKANPDVLSCMGRNQAVTRAGTLLNGMQGWPPEEQLAAVSVLFALAAIAYEEISGHKPGDFHDIGKALATTDTPGDIKGNNAAQSLRDYFTLRIAGRETTIM